MGSRDAAHRYGSPAGPRFLLASGSASAIKRVVGKAGATADDIVGLSWIDIHIVARRVCS
eukprot:5194618-Lingulodinium_polyedra.AAC.1